MSEQSEQAASERQPEEEDSQAQSSKGEPAGADEAFLEKFKNDDGSIDYDRLVQSTKERERVFHKSRQELAEEKKRADTFAKAARQMQDVNWLAQNDPKFATEFRAAYNRATGQPEQKTEVKAVETKTDDDYAKELQSKGVEASLARELAENRRIAREAKEEADRLRAENAQDKKTTEYQIEWNEFRRKHSGTLFDESGEWKDDEMKTQIVGMVGDDSGRYENVPLEDIRLIAEARLGRNAAASQKNEDKTEAMRASSKRGQAAAPQQQVGDPNTEVALGMNEADFIKRLRAMSGR